MPDDVLDDLPIDDPSRKKGKKAKKKRDSGAPVEEIDAITTELPEIAEQPEPVAEELPPEYEESEPVDSLDAISPPAKEEEQSPWEKFLTALPKELLTLLYDCGLLALDQLLAQSRQSLTLPVGKFTERQVKQLCAAMRVFDWELAADAPAVEAPVEPQVDTTVAGISHDDISAERQRARNTRLLRMRRFV